MRFTRIIAIAVIIGSLGTGAAQAQSFDRQPSEFPPASYKGKQYVDSKGCVFIRAGIDGNVTWVPRVSRKREGVCGFKPTNVGTAVTTAPSTAVAAPMQITLNSTPAQAAPVAKVAPRPVPKIPAAPVVVRQTAPKSVRQTAPVVVAAPKAVPAPAAPVQSAAVCAGRSALSQRYSGSPTAKLAVRCGPQAEKILPSRAPVVSATRTAAPGYGTKTVTAAPSAAAIGPHTRIAPLHVAQARVHTNGNVSVPKGYKSVWTDDRLNERRAEQTLAGRSQMLLIWTNTVPRRLINPADGRDMTAQVPLVYPYTTIAQQERELGQVTFATRDGQLVKKIVRNRKAALVTRKPIYSTRSAPKTTRAAPAKVQATGSTYVQVGVFASSANAQKTAHRIAKMGMGARIGKSTRGGKTYLSVQAGPFGAARAPAALGKLRGVGFKDAYIR